MAIYRCAACGGVNHATADAGAPAEACTRCRRPLDRSGQPQDVDAAALVSAIRSSPAPVLVDFSDAPSVALDEVARACAGELVVLRVHPPSEPAAAAAYRIGPAPTLVLFFGGTEVARRAGRDPGDLTTWMESAAAVRVGGGA
jgi:thioredoxin 2